MTTCTFNVGPTILPEQRGYRQACGRPTDETGRCELHALEVRDDVAGDPAGTWGVYEAGVLLAVYRTERGATNYRDRLIRKGVSFR